MSENEYENGNGELTGLQRAFVDAWFECGFNGTEAAKRAGYSGDDRALAVRASENVRKRKVREAIEQRWAAHGVTGEEVIARLAGWMRFNIAELFDEHGRLNWQAVRRHGHNIKRITWDKGNNLSVEVHDSMKAAELVGKTMALFTDRVQQETSGEVIVRFAPPEGGE